MTALIRHMVEAIDPLDEREAADQADVLSWIDSGASLYRTAKPATPPKHLVSYCALVDADHGSVLLVDHLDAGLWMPTGGHIDPGEEAPDAASREIHEELAIAPPFLPTVGAAPVLLTVTQTQGRSLSHTDVSLWFAFAGSVDTKLHPDVDEFASTQWFQLADIAHGPGTRFEPNLPRFVNKLSKL